MAGITPDRLRRWHHSGLLPGTAGPDGRLQYSFRDIVTARTAAALLGKGIKATRVRRAVEALRTWRPEMSAPLASMRVFSEGGQLLVQVDGAVMEPISGQLLLALPEGEASALSARPPGRVVAPAQREPPVAWTAQGAFEAGLRAEKTGHLEAAEDAYRLALSRDPAHPGALLNLGNALYARGDHTAALGLYRQACRVAEDYPEAHYNLGNVLDDFGDTEGAVRCFEDTLALAPDFKAAHFNLALVWEKVGERDRARAHWQAYLGLEPDGESADVARSFLQLDDETGD